MKENNSPWIYQLNRTRPENKLASNTQTDVLIIGGGIAGISTLYFTLKNTDRQVCLLEARRVAHGATGHNAGYVNHHFEKSYRVIIDEYGKEMAMRDIKAVDGAREFLDEMITVAGRDVPCEKVVSYGGYEKFEMFLEHLNDLYMVHGKSEFPEPIRVSQNSDWFEKLPIELSALCEVVPHEQIAELLETSETHYMAAMPGRAIIVNSALLTDRVLAHCLEKYKDRVYVYELSPVHGIELGKGAGRAFSGEYSVSFKEVVLATNGFENFYIKNNVGREIDAKFHHDVVGVVGYMTGYLTDEPISSAAKYIYSGTNLSNDAMGIEPYFYLTRRNFKSGSHTKLVSVGGPEVRLEDREVYFYEYDVDDAIYKKIDDFITTQKVPKKYERHFRWHGLMGYTKSGLRLIGREPENPVLLYNIGCNGIGILTSIYGGSKISDILAGKPTPPSIFDPKRK